MKLSRILLSLVAIATIATSAVAAGDHKGHDHEGEGAKHAHDAKPRFGGVVSVVKDVNYELVAKPDALALYVSDHDTPVDLKGATAKVTLLSTAGKSEATLMPAGERLETKGSFNAAAGIKAVALVTLAGKKPASVRFTLK